MKVLQPGDTRVFSLYPEIMEDIKKNVGNLRPHMFMLVTDGEDGTLMYNTITNELLLFEANDDIFDEHMIDNFWVVPEDFDEVAFVFQYREHLFNSRRNTINPRGYTIITTTGCNARCFYCYEKGIKRNDMTQKTANDLADYIISNYEKDPKESRSEVTLSWFGGEPLFNKSVIDTICTRLRDADVKYRSSMISNGYLFDEETIEKAKTLWNLRNVQITLDGTEEVYNKAKNYIDKSVSPFQVVTNNIDNLTKNGIRVSVRINVGFYNKDDIKELVKYLRERFEKKKNFSIYFHALFDNGGVTDIDTEEKEKEVYETMTMLEEQVTKNGLLSERSLQAPKGTHCMADNGNHVTVQADGRFSLCEHYVDTYQVGGLHEKSFDDEIIKKFKEIAPPFEQCYTCPIFPGCSNLVMCEDNEVSCGQYRQNYKIQKKIRAMKSLERRVKRDNKKKEIREKSNEHAYVDLGLPSGTLWAKHNVGAKKDWDDGKPFAWGEILSKDKYTQDGHLTNEKYQRGYIKNLELVDDAAQACMGGDWHIPTLEQCQELIENTTSAWTVYNGVKGTMLTSKINNGLIFFPAAGYFEECDSKYCGEKFCLWSSTVADDNENGIPVAWYFSGNEENIGIGTLEQWRGLPVRGVLPKV